MHLNANAFAFDPMSDKDCCVKRGRDLKYKSKTASKLYNYITIYIFYHIEKILLQMQSNIFLIKYF